MKNILGLILFLIVSNFYAQNIGINNLNPAHTLDVNGNINTTGTIVANGDKGSANQMLIKNNSNELAWSSIDGLKNFQQFTTNQIFVIPPGVTKIIAELWAGGGGGDRFRGGGGGAYAKVIFTVSAGKEISISVGSGGQGGNFVTLPSGGGATGISYGTVGDGDYQFINVLGGLAPSGSAIGDGGSNFNTSGIFPYIFYRGYDGLRENVIYSQAGANSFVKDTTHGKGGDAANNPNSGGLGGKTVETDGIVTTSYLAYVGQSYGGGGGGSNPIGANGFKGQVILYW